MMSSTTIGAQPRTSPVMRRTVTAVGAGALLGDDGHGKIEPRGIVRGELARAQIGRDDNAGAAVRRACRVRQ